MDNPSDKGTEIDLSYCEVILPMEHCIINALPLLSLFAIKMSGGVWEERVTLLKE